MPEIGRNFFHFQDTGTRFIADDARHYLRTTRKKYDLIVFDVLNSDTQPSYIFTRESLTELKGILAERGMVIIEFQEFPKQNGPFVYQSICNTLLALGYKTYLNDGDDRIIVASLEDLDGKSPAYDQLTYCCKGQDWAREFLKQPFTRVEKPYPDGVVLSDDRPLIDVLNADTIKRWRQNAIGSYANKLLNIPEGIFH